MADVPDLDARMETVARRVEFIELLDEEGALPPRDIVDALSYSRPTVTRALRELREAALVEKVEGGYRPTLPGTMAVEEYRRYETASKTILSSDELLAPIPEEHAPPAEVLTGATTSLAGDEIPLRALETVSDRVRQADEVRSYLPTLVNTHLLRTWHRAVVTTSVESEAIFHPDLLTVLEGQYPHLLAEMAATDGFSAFSATGPPYGVLLTTAGDTTTASIIVYGEDTALRGILTNDSPAAVEWARATLDGCSTDATGKTADLEALSGAVADGLATPHAAEHSATPPDPAGNLPGRTADGHPLPIDLTADGFVRLSGEYFDTRGRKAPAVGWRTGFALPEVRAGHAVDRRDAEGRNLVHRLVEAGRNGADQAVLGPPGSGKSTVCMAAACEWYDRGLGPVLYRESGAENRFTSPALLEAYLRQSEGHALVVVEDAVREGADAIFAVVQALDADQSVTFLVDARTHEWHNPESATLDAQLDTFRRTAVEAVTVPDVDETACDRFVEQFTALVGADLGLTGRELFSLVEAGTATGRDGSLPAGTALIVQHVLSRRHDPSVDAGAPGGTALDEAVRQAYRRLDAGPEPALDLGVLVAALTAAGIPVAREYCFAVADAEYGTLEEALSLLNGTLLFQGTHPRNGGSTTYRTRHETWAMRFLAQVLATEPEHRARERFGRGVTRLVALADDPARRERIERHLGGRTPHLHRIEADPRGWADELLERLFGLGRANATLAPLFGATADDALALPEACSERIHVQQAYWRGEMNRTRGDLPRAEREFRTLGELADTVALDGTAAAPEFLASPEEGAAGVSANRTRWRATSEIRLGEIARDRGDCGAAEEHHQDALALCRDLGDRGGEAVSLTALGRDALARSEYDRAQEYFEHARELFEDVGDRDGIAAVQLEQAHLALARDEPALARERGLDARDAFDELERPHDLARCRRLLGRVAAATDGSAEAREHWLAALETFDAVGASRDVLSTLQHLVEAGRVQGDTERAREWCRQARDVLSEAPESTAARHRDWIERHAADLAVERDGLS